MTGFFRNYGLLVLILVNLLQLPVMIIGILVALRVLSHVSRTNGRVLDYDEIPLTGITTEAQRTKLLKFYRRIQKAMESQTRRCFFLSIDMERSSEMKRGERAIDVDSTFYEFDSLVRRCLTENHCWKSAWTPDGVMAAFMDADDGFGAAKCVLGRLAEFNRKDNRLKSKIRVRTGYAYGEVVIFDDSEIERVSDPSIDLAGHLQKAAPPGCLLIATIAHTKIQATGQTEKWDQEVDGKAVYIYRPEES